MSKGGTKQRRMDALTPVNNWAYGVGHFLNDLAAACWFNFLLVYLTNFNPIDKTNPGFYAGLVVLCGQIADGLATPVVGYFSDRTKSKYGQRKIWYYAGFALVVPCFLMIFQNCPFDKDTPNHQMYKTIYYCFFPSAFNVGWAFMQVSHMCMVCNLTNCPEKKDQLNGIRNTFTFFANFLVLGTALLFFNVIDDQVFQFQLLSYVILGVGSATSIFFMWNIDENYLFAESQRLKHLNEKLEKQNKIQYENLANTISNDQQVLQNYDQVNNQHIFIDKQEQIQNYGSTSNNIDQQEKQSLKVSFKDINQQEKDQLKVSFKSSSKYSINQSDSVLEDSYNENKNLINQINEEDSMLYTTNTKQSSNQQKVTITDTNEESIKSSIRIEKIKNVSFWFKQIDFYIYGAIYSFVRIVNNVYNVKKQSQSLLNFYLIYNLKVSPDATKTPIAIAVVPLISNISQIYISYKIEILYKRFGRFNTFSFGTFIVTICAIVYYFLTPETSYLVYPTAFFSGISMSICLNTGIAFISDVVGVHGKSGAFVYGCYGLLDKFSCGIILFFLMNTESFETHNEDYIRGSFIIFPIVSCYASLILMKLGKAGKDFHVTPLKESLIDAQETYDVQEPLINSSKGSFNRAQDGNAKLL